MNWFFWVLAVSELGVSAMALWDIGHYDKYEKSTVTQLALRAVLNFAVAIGIFYYAS